jgi:sugar phosphate isomerase/epimerase
MKLAIQEDMLLGRTMLEKFELARQLGFDGVEFWGSTVSRQVEAITEAMAHTGLKTSGINVGRQAKLLGADPAERELALEQLRRAITDAADLGAEGVVFVPAFHGPDVPDLSPLMTAEQLESELLIAHLRTLEDFANAVGVTLFIEPINRYETHFLNRVEQAAALAHRRAHPRVKVCADVFHMALEEADLGAALRTHADVVGYVHLADNNRRLPGQGITPFAQVGAALREIGYTGWLSLECGEPSANQPFAERYASDLPASVAFLREAGLG